MVRMTLLKQVGFLWGVCDRATLATKQKKEETRKDILLVGLSGAISTQCWSVPPAAIA